MSKSVLDKVEYLILLIAEFSARHKVTEVQAYRYLNQYGALALCDKHYNIMHTLSVEELNNQKQVARDSEDFNIMGICVQKGKITLVKGLAEDGLDEFERKLIGLRALRQAQGPQWLNDKKLGIIPTDRKFTGSNPNLTIEQMLTAALEIPENQKPDIA